MDEETYKSKLIGLKLESPTLEWKTNILCETSFMDMGDCEAVENFLYQLIDSLIEIGAGDLNGNTLYSRTVKFLYDIAESPKVGFSELEKEGMLDFLNRISSVIVPGVLECPDSREHFKHIYRMGHKL